MEAGSSSISKLSNDDVDEDKRDKRSVRMQDVFLSLGRLSEVHTVSVYRRDHHEIDENSVLVLRSVQHAIGRAKMATPLEPKLLSIGPEEHQKLEKTKTTSSGSTTKGDRTSVEKEKDAGMDEAKAKAPPKDSKTTEEKDGSKSQTPTTSRSFASYIPPWVITNIKNTRSLKTLLRCWLAGWIGFVIILPNTSLNTLGASCVPYMFEYHRIY